MTRKKKNQICYSNYAEAEFEASMKHTSAQTPFQGLGLIQDRAEEAQEHEGGRHRARGLCQPCICLDL